jgi:GxxExxY protein
MPENEISKLILDSAIAVHRELGPGLLESVYEIVLAYELQQRGLRVDRQVPIAIRYKDMIFDAAFRADLVVEEKVLVELKSVEQISEAHKKQVQTYLRLRGYKLGFLLNFGEALMKRGITRVVNGLKDD